MSENKTADAVREALPMVVMTAPEKIYLTVSDDHYDADKVFPDDHAEICWCEDEAIDVCVPYVRADVAEAKLAALTARVAELAAEITRLEEMAESRLRAIESLKPDRLASLAGAAPDRLQQATSLLQHLYDHGYTTVADHEKVAEFLSHAPAKAREVTDDVGDGMRYRLLRAASITWDGRRWPDPIELDQATSAALATFAEGE